MWRGYKHPTMTLSLSVRRMEGRGGGGRPTIFILFFLVLFLLHAMKAVWDEELCCFKSGESWMKGIRCLDIPNKKTNKKRERNKRETEKKSIAKRDGIERIRTKNTKKTESEMRIP